MLTSYEDMVDDEEALALVQDIRRACEHSSALTRQLLSFSRKEVPAPRAIDLNTLVEETLGMVGRLLGSADPGREGARARSR